MIGVIAITGRAKSTVYNEDCLTSPYFQFPQAESFLKVPPQILAISENEIRQRKWCFATLKNYSQPMEKL